MPKTSLEMVAYRRGNPDLEKAYHSAFWRYRIRGEWFHPAAGLIAEVDRLGAPNISGTGKR